MSSTVRVMVGLVLLLLCCTGHGQSCARDQCNDVLAETATPGQEQSLLQRSTWKQKMKVNIANEGSTALGFLGFPSQLKCWSHMSNGQCAVPVPGGGTALPGSCGVAGDGITGLCGSISPPWSGVCSQIPLGQSCSWAGFPGVCTGDPYLGSACDVWSAVATTTTPTPPSACPVACYSPQCTAGGSYNGGFLLEGGSKCIHFCSKKFSGLRYCGGGPDYTIGDSIDCRGCAGACPSSCQDPACVTGGAHNGGLALVNGACQHRCSMVFAGLRYCGSGNDYNVGDSIDCSSCATVTTTTPAVPTVCSPYCTYPVCVAGGSWNGGTPLANNQCNHHCSKEFLQPGTLQKVRYCGTGKDYTEGDSVDCTACIDNTFVHAPDGSVACPAGYDWITDLGSCQAGITIAGTQYTWSGISGCHNNLWPRAGCFSYATQLYWSTCDATRPMSLSSHDGICRKAR